MAAIHDTQEDHAVLSITEARQAQRGKHIAWVLGLSMALIILGFIGLYLYHAPHLLNGKSGGQTSADATTLQQAAGFNAPPSQPRESQNPQTTPGLTPGVGADGPLIGRSVETRKAAPAASSNQP